MAENSGPRINVNLAVSDGDQGRRVVVMDKSPFLLGRHTDCDCRLDSATVSRRHCELKLKRIGLTAKDLGSRNGTIVNGKKLTPGKRYPIKAGDLLEIGKFSVEVSSVAIAGNGPTHLAVGSTALDANQADLLSSLDMIVSNVLATKATSETVDDAEPDADCDMPTVDWSFLKLTTIDAGETAQVPHAKAALPAPTVAETPPKEVVAFGDEPEPSSVDDEEERRKKLRERLEELKAKDSKEAAGRALRDFFGGR